METGMNSFASASGGSRQRTGGRPTRLTLSSWFPCAVLIAAAAATPPHLPAADAGPKRWTDDQLVASYRDLASVGGLESAVRSPALPKDPPRPGFLDALAWYAAGTPDRPGVLTLKTLDELLGSNVQSYLGFLKAKVERREDNDYPRTRTWKVIQKLTLLREEMSQPQRNGRYSFTASPNRVLKNGTQRRI
jgi:hypothetical protein